MSPAAIIETNMASSPGINITATIQEYGKRLMSFIRKRVNIEADAEDILQDVFYQLAGNTEPIEQMSAWLFRVTRNKITDRHRKHKPALIDDVYMARPGEDLFDWAELLPYNGSDPELDELRSIFRSSLQEALNELPGDQKTVFIMNELEGIPFKEIAEVTGVSVNTLLSRKRYAVLHLRERLSWLRDELNDLGR